MTNWTCPATQLASPDWGWNPDTFEAVGTVVAALIAASAALVAILTYRRSRKDAERAQADRITVWKIGASPDDSGWPPSEERPGWFDLPRLKYLAFVRNSSPDTISNVRYVATAVSEDGRRRQLEVIEREIVPPSSDPGGIALGPEYSAASRNPVFEGEDLELEIEFTDLEGRRWRRRETGKPERI